MSSLGTPGKMKGTGLLLDHVNNRFSTYNQIMVFYCSSDTWLGDAAPGTVVTTDSADQLYGNELTTDIQFRGARIVNTVMTALETAGGLTVRRPNKSIVYRLPQMSHARSVLLSGDSAGGNGMRHNLDRFNSRIDAKSIYGANNENGVPVIGFLDAGGIPYPWKLDYTNHPDFSDYDDMMYQTYEQQKSFHGVTPAALDDSCIPNEKNESKCADHSNVQRNYITTPLFHRASLRDSLKIKAFIGTAANPGMMVDQLELAQESAAAAHDLITAGVYREGPMQIMAPQCTSHIVWSNGRYYRQRSGAPQRRVYQRLTDYVLSCEAGICVANNEIDNPNIGAFANGTVCN